ncbi:MAG: AbrB/MazE/SpoVT family DNA-binding domain-containing protein [Pseudomonadota bacterium]
MDTIEIDEVSMDKSGRVVIPKDVRQKLGLHTGIIMKLVQIAGKGLQLIPVYEKSALVEDGGLFYKPAPAGAAPMNREAVRDRMTALRNPVARRRAIEEAGLLDADNADQ